MLIELNGSNAGVAAEGFQFSGGASGGAGSSVRGLVINNFSGSGFIIGANDVTVAGTYIGTDTDGLIDQGNLGAGITTNGGSVAARGATIGGLNPADRNLISGNEDSAAYPLSDWVIQGNYIGLDVTGESALPNSSTQASGAFSIDNCSDVTIGGTVVGATNVISGNASHGLAPDNSPGIVIEGNLIGTDWTGQVAIPNQSGVTISGDQTGSVIGGTTPEARNIISGNSIAGIIAGATGGPHIEGNYVGLNIDGDTPIPNETGILAAGSDIIIGGGSTSTRNVVSGNIAFNVSVQGILAPTVDNEVRGNYIGTNAAGDVDSAITSVQGEGVRIAGDSSDNIVTGNRIAGNRDSGVGVRSLTITQFSATATPGNNAILGNEIYSNIPGGTINDGEGSGIDIYTATVASLGFPADILADSYTERGNTVNDPTDVDTGPNGFMNTPIINTATQNGAELTVNFDLYAADSPVDQYRVEFFANDTADYGSGKAYLGAITSANGDSQNESFTLPASYNTQGKYISATTTALNASTNSGFGSTSEFSGNVLASVTTAPVTAVANNGALAKTGDEISNYILMGVGASATGLAIALGRKRFVKYRV